MTFDVVFLYLILYFIQFLVPFVFFCLGFYLLVRALRPSLWIR